MQNKHTAITAIFFTTCLASAFILVTSTLNYVEFYRAMANLTLQLLDVSPSIETNNVNVTLMFSITNPTSYHGLRLRELSYTLTFEAFQSQLSLYGDVISFADQPLIVDPYWNKTFEYQIRFNMRREQTVNFIELYESQPQDALWSMRATVLVDTFVGIIDVPLTATVVSSP